MHRDEYIQEKMIHTLYLKKKREFNFYFIKKKVKLKNYFITFNSFAVDLKRIERIFDNHVSFNTHEN